MGQKVNPHVLRLGPVYNWTSRWFNTKQYKDIVLEDYKLRKAIMDKLKTAGVARVEIERSINNVKFIIYVSRPGMVIGRAGSGLEELKQFIIKTFLGLSILYTKKTTPKIDIRIEAIKEPNLEAYLVAKNISDQLIRRMPHKRVLGQSADRAMAAGAKGIRILLAGRVGGAEIARREKIQMGTVPLSTIRERIDFASYPSLTKKGYVGVKVWINKPDNK